MSTSVIGSYLIQSLIKIIPIYQFLFSLSLCCNVQVIMVCLLGLATIWLVVIFGWREAMPKEDLRAALHKPGLCKEALT